jgi:hypothetical protein
VDEKHDRKRLAHLMTEPSPDGELVLGLQRSVIAQLASGDILIRRL